MKMKADPNKHNVDVQPVENNKHTCMDYSGADDVNEPLDNRSDNTTFDEVLNVSMSRRSVMKGSLGSAALALFGLPLSMSLTACSSDTKAISPVVGDGEKLGFRGISTSVDDKVHVPEGYTARLFYAWGDPISDGPEFMQDASNTAADQAVQAGMHHDGMHFFSLPVGSNTQDHGLLVLNHEYIDPTILHNRGGNRDAPELYTLEKANKELAAHGVSVIEVKKVNGQWNIIRPSSLARRITMDTVMDIRGPAAGSHWMKTSEEPTGLLATGTMNNCAHGYTPWGTYLTCEENFHGYFAGYETTIPDEKSIASLTRYGIDAGDSSRYGWERHHDRFDTAKQPNEPNRFGWVVEIDPFDPASRPIKRTALGRIRHENAAHIIADNGRVAVYMGDDARHEYIYKFVTAGSYNASDRAANRHLLDEGILYVAKFNDNNKGEWLPLVHGENGLTTANGFTDQADVLVRTRAAADLVGATKMDRPEWIAVHPDSGDVYCTLTNNASRTTTTNAANPRLNNLHGHIIRWQEHNNDATATSFDWDIFVLAGNPASTHDNLKGNIKGDIFSSPDGLWIDPRGIMWIQTDVSGSKQIKGEFLTFGNNQMLACDPADGEMRRFLTGPLGQEITGVITTPDMKAMFVNIQHPGDVPGGLRDVMEKTPDNPTAASTWPDGVNAGRPRSSTIIITKDDGGIIGT